MPPIERDVPSYWDRPSSSHSHSSSSRHSHSQSFSFDQSRALVPMWDSSDPERAPPPLPMNPQSPVAPTSRAGTSPAIQSAHAALAEKARDNSLVPRPLSKRTPDISPERNFAKGAAHRRMQSLQPSSVRDLSMMIEGGALSTSPTKRDRPVTPSRSSTDPFNDLSSENSERSDEKEDRPLNFTHAGPTVTPVIRPTPRRPQSILSENTPPQSATMLALQNMSTPKDSPREKDGDNTPLANVTNGSTAASRAPHSMDQLSNQILTLTNIATTLQKEMSQLSRRSRDNATDLLSLKEATNTRDEDIRKNLRDLLHNMHDVQSRAVSRDSFGGPLMLDNKPYSLSPPSSKPGANPRPFSLPRIPSPHSFAASIDRESISTPSLVGTDAPASMGLLEKIIRDMGTKEGQEKLYSRLSELGEKLNGFNVEKKIEELQLLVKSNMDQSVVLAGAAGGGGGGGKSGNTRHMSFDEDPDDYHNGSIGARFERLIQDQEVRTRRASTPTARAAADLISDDIMKIIRTIKDSVAQGGGLTAEVKALVRELRGEVLGMGREIGRRLDEVAETSQTETASATKLEINKVVEDGMLEMKDHINHLIDEHQRHSQSVVAANKPSAVDYQEIYNAMRTALKDSKALQKDMPDLQREDVIDAVREAWETYKPEISVEQIGLERDEILACLKEGLMQHTPRDEQHQAATKDEVFDAIMEGLEHFEPPPIETPPTLSRDEIIEAVRDCLEEFEFPVAPSAIGADLSKQDMVDAVKQGLEGFDLPAKDNGSLVPFQNKDEIVGRLHEIMDYMRAEFKAVSEEAKQNMAANGRDTEQVLDATKDGLEKLRSDIEGYVDRATGVAGQEEFMEGLLKSLDEFREDIEDLVVKQSDGSNQMIKEELGSLRDAVNGTLVPATPQPQQGNYQEVIHALQDGLGSLRLEISQRPIAGTNEVLDALQDGLTELKNSIDKLADKPSDLTANDEVLDALKSGLDGVKSDIEGLREQSKALTTISSDIVPATNALKHEDIKNLEVLLAQLHVKVEAIEAQPVQSTPTPAEPGLSLNKEDIDLMVEMLDSIKLQVEEIASKEPAAPKATTNAPDGPMFEDVEAVETILRNTKARLDDLMDGEQAVRKDHVDALEVLILETKESLGGLTGKIDELSHKEDTKAVESLVTQVVGAFDDMKTRHDKILEDPEKVTKTDMNAIEAVCLDVKTVIDQIVKSDIAALSSKEDLKNLQTLIEEIKEASDRQTTEFKEATEKHTAVLREAAEKHATELKELTDKHAETNLNQFEERQAETVGVGERVSEVKTFLEEMHSLVKDRLDQGFTGLEGLSKSLGTIGETISPNANVHSDLKEMFETMKKEFEDSRASIVGAKLETDETFEQSTEALRTKIDERIDEVLSKYDDFQAVVDERNKASDSHDDQLEESLMGTKAVADELKGLVDTLGSTVMDSLEKMEDASKTVFTRVEDMVLKSDDNHTENKGEHAQTRDQVKEFMGIFEGFKGDINEYQPKILEAVKDVLLMVGQHFEHSKTSVTEMEEKISQRIEEAKPEPLMLPPPPEQYDDSQVHKKLDKLVSHTGTASRAFEQLNTLDKVHQQVVLTAAELSAFLASQTQRIENDQDDREKSLQRTEKNLHEATVGLERSLAQKDHAETTVASLHEEEDRLRQSIVELRVEQESLVRQKVQLTGDVSSLETALKIRREELHDMEARAEGLERRILEGVMDQSRILLMAKSAKKATSARDVMSRKRVTSKQQQKPAGAENEDPNEDKHGATTARSKPHQKLAFATALNSKRNGESRRILSLSQLNKQAGLNTAAANAGAAFKRSQSVKTLTGAGALRKSSWAGGRVNGGQKSYGELHAGEGDKENVDLDVVALRESDEEGFDEATPVSETGGEGVLVPENPGEGSIYDDPSDTDTLRKEDLRAGAGSEAAGSGYDDAYDTYSDPGSDWTESAVGSGATDSMVSGSEGSGVGTEGSEVVLYDGIEGPD